MRSRNQATTFHTRAIMIATAILGASDLAAASPNILTWLGTSGLYPDEILPCYTYLGSSPVAPALDGGVLTITTFTNVQTSYYRQTLDLLQWPHVIEIEFEMRLISGSSSSAIRGPFAVWVEIDQTSTAIVHIDMNKVFVLASATQVGQTAFVDTTQEFHHYRFTVQQSTGEVHVFYDHDPTPLLSGPILSHSPTGNIPHIGWGNASGFSHGVSEWLSFSHNASYVPGDLNGDGHVGVADLLLLLQAWGPCSDPDDCPADQDGDGAVGVGDLLILLGNWGPACP